jgi:NAD(P)H-dependent flavin oxidoreductase YrpB (nitropropane dioxygenase family)
VTADFTDTIRTLVVSGRPLRVKQNEYIAKWESQPEKIKELTGKGVVPMAYDMEHQESEVDMPYLMGQVAAIIKDIKPAREVVEEMVQLAIEQLRLGSTYIETRSKL